MFTSARIKLTLWYLVIIMTISVIFSFIIYNVQSAEASRILQRQRVLIERGGFLPANFNQVTREVELLEDTQNRLKFNLFLINLAVLVFSGGAAYFLAGRTLKPIEEMVDDQRRFVADASHELRTPLTTMKTEIEVNLRNKNVGTDAKKILQSNLEEVDKLSYLSDKLLKLSRYEADSVKLTRISLKDVLETAIKKVSTSAKVKKIEFNPSLSGLEIQGDESGLTEAFGTILDNAIKYSPKGSKIDVTLELKNQKALITIRDYGIGINETDLPHIFNRFYRADNSRQKEKIDGFGLGLSIAKKIIEKHNGKIEVKSVPAVGSTFTITLPLELKKTSGFSQF